MIDLTQPSQPYGIALPYGLEVTVRPLTTAGMAAAQAAARRAVEAIDDSPGNAQKPGCHWTACPTSRPMVSVTASTRRS